MLILLELIMVITMITEDSLLLLGDTSAPSLALQLAPGGATALHVRREL